MPIVDLQGLRIHYLEAGRGPVVLLLHGWPMSSFLWRRAIPRLAERNRVIALDLPGFGGSDKPLDVAYTLAFYADVLERFCVALGLGEVGLVVHDLGGPAGLTWATQHPGRIRRLAVLNTLVYPKIAFGAAAFLWACRVPGLRALVATPWFLRFTLRMGLVDRRLLTDELVAAVVAPFTGRDARRVLARTMHALVPADLRALSKRLPSLRHVPLRLLYGERDHLIPDVARTMKQLAVDLPLAQVTALPACGHFLQEERPDEVAEVLAGFFAAGHAPR